MAEPVSIRSPELTCEGPPIYTSTYLEFYRLSTKDAQDILRDYPVIVLSDRPTRLKCDLVGVEEFGDLDDLREIHGVYLLISTCQFISNFSLDFTRFHPTESESTITRATYREFFETSKIVNYLDNPLTSGVYGPTQLATDLRALMTDYEDFPTDYPIRTMNWGLLGKANAIHIPHTDRPGTCTWVGIEDGIKKWDVAFPPKDKAEQEAADTAAFAGHMVWGRNYDRGWRWHSILLYPGSMMSVFVI
jgi:hypothetical protein